MNDLQQNRWYRVYPDDERFPDQWHLSEPRTADDAEIDARQLRSGRHYSGALPTIVPVGNPGKELAFNFGAFDMPVAAAAVAETICRVAPSDIECFPVRVPGATGSYVILNVICSLDCLDEEKSEFTRWTVEDERPDRLGQYHMISTIRIDPSRTQNHHIFRIKDWPLALLVSGTLKDSLETIPDSLLA